MNNEADHLYSCSIRESIAGRKSFVSSITNSCHTFSNPVGPGWTWSSGKEMNNGGRSAFTRQHQGKYHRQINLCEGRLRHRKQRKRKDARDVPFKGTGKPRSKSRSNHNFFWLIPETPSIFIDIAKSPPQHFGPSGRALGHIRSQASREKAGLKVTTTEEGKVWSQVRSPKEQQNPETNRDGEYQALAQCKLTPDRKRR